MRSRTGFDLIKAFRVKDDFTIEMELSRPFVPFLWAWQNMHIIPRHILGNEANLATATFNANPVGTGPFLLRSRTAGSHMVYERNPNYHLGPAKVRSAGAQQRMPVVVRVQAAGARLIYGASRIRSSR